ncbi:MAG: hypothetical protein LBR47_05415 [Spirochaetaceae bacterium]|nr:hypothetical protein [Spirochaetaceae bacterium]
MRKKIVIAAAGLVFVCSAAMWAAETVYSDLYYIYVPVVRVLQHRDGYVVYYQKKSYGIGKTYIPKKWFSGTGRKATFAPLEGYMDPYMTVYYNKGEFQRVRLNLPSNPSDPIWDGLYTDENSAEVFNIDTISIQY